MAAVDTELGGSEESRTRSAGSVSSWESELTSLQHSLKFVLKLKEEFVCPICRGVVLNPQQNACGHIYCFHCLQGLLATAVGSSTVCPVDGAIIVAAEVFQDNCCKREILDLEVFCTNAPECASVVTLHHLQEHLSQCQYQQLQCTSPGCKATLQRRFLQKHLTNQCPHRSEPCPHCGQPRQLSYIENHVENSCPDMEVDCPNSCFQKIPKHKITALGNPSNEGVLNTPSFLSSSVELIGHRESCPEVPVECPYKKFGCFVKGKSADVKFHRDAAVNHHMLLVLRTNLDLEQQVEVLQREALLRQQEVQVDNLRMTGLQREIQQSRLQSSCQQHNISTAQRTVSRQDDIMSTVHRDFRQVSPQLPALEEIEYLKCSVDFVMQEVSTAEALREHLGSMEEALTRHSDHLDLHSSQLSLNQQRLEELQASAYEGVLIWKIQDFRKKKDTEGTGHRPCLTSVPFHTGRCGYKMAVKAYLNGDGEGSGTHLSLYVVLMPGDFDALLPWPFKQTVSLSILDQSGKGKHRSLSFRPDPASKSFQRPAAESVSNVALGFSCFFPLDELEASGNAKYIKDDTLFVKAKVDITGLEHL